MYLWPNISILGDVPLHANVLIILLSSLDLDINSSSIPSELLNYKLVDQIQIISGSEFIVNSSGSFQTTDDLVLIFGDSPNLLTKVLDTISKIRPNLMVAPVVSTTTVWVDWCDSFKNLALFIHKWPGIRNYGLNSRLYFNSKNSGDDSYSVFEAYYVLNLVVIHKLEAFPLESRTGRRKNFKRVLITVSHVKPWNFKSDSGYATTTFSYNTVTITYQFLGFMQDFLNFRVQTVSWIGLDAKAVGSGGAQQDWDDITKHFLQESSDLTISGTGMTSNRAQNRRFLSPPSYSESTYVNYVSPTASIGEQGNIFLRCFTNQVWLMVIGMVCILVMCRFILTKNAQNSIWSIIAYLLLREWEKHVDTINSTSIRSLMLTASWFFFVLYASFFSNLTSRLSVPVEQIQTISSLIDKGFKFSIRNDSYLTVYRADDSSSSVRSTATWHSNSIRSRTGNSIRKVFENLHPVKPYLTTEQGAAAVLHTHNLAFLSNEYIYYFVLKEWDHEKMCQHFRLFPISKYNVQFSSFVRKDSPFAEHFNYARLKMTEGGVTNLHLRKQKAYNEQSKPECVQGKLRQFEIGDATFPFAFIIISYLACFAVLGLEISLIARKII